MISFNKSFCMLLFQCNPIFRFLQLFHGWGFKTHFQSRCIGLGERQAALERLGKARGYMALGIRLQQAWIQPLRSLMNLLGSCTQNRLLESALAASTRWPLLLASGTDGCGTAVGAVDFGWFIICVFLKTGG